MLACQRMCHPKQLRRKQLRYHVCAYKYNALHLPEFGQARASGQRVLGHRGWPETLQDQQRYLWRFQSRHLDPVRLPNTEIKLHCRDLSYSI